MTGSIKIHREFHKAYQSRRYKFQMKDLTKQNHTFKAIGLGKIASIDKALQARKLAHWFPGVSTIARQAFASPYGVGKVLLGMTSWSVYCKDRRQVGNIRLNKSVFHPGWVLTGCAPTSQPGKEDTSSKAPAAEASSSSLTSLVGDSQGHKGQKQLKSTRIQEEQVISVLV